MRAIDQTQVADCQCGSLVNERMAGQLAMHAEVIALLRQEAESLATAAMRAVNEPAVSLPLLKKLETLTELYDKLMAIEGPCLGGCAQRPVMIKAGIRAVTHDMMMGEAKAATSAHNAAIRAAMAAIAETESRVQALAVMEGLIKP